MLNKNIKELRLERGLTQAQLADQIGVTQGAVYFWEKGVNEPTAGYLIKMAELFGISVDELLSFECERMGEQSTRAVEMNRYFSKLTVKQQDLLIETAKEFLKI